MERTLADQHGRRDPLIRRALLALCEVVPRQAQHDVGATAREHALAAVLVCGPIHVPKTLDEMAERKTRFALSINHRLVG